MIYLASDHAGFLYKGIIARHLESRGIEYTDVGPHAYDANDDYTDYVIPASVMVAKDPHRNKGIVLGGSGNGEAIAANKVEGIRAGVYYGGEIGIVELMRKHNDANVISLGARFISRDDLAKIVDTFLDTAFSGEERHERRIGKISGYESGKNI